MGVQTDESSKDPRNYRVVLILGIVMVSMMYVNRRNQMVAMTKP